MSSIGCPYHGFPYCLGPKSGDLRTIRHITGQFKQKGGFSIPSFTPLPVFLSPLFFKCPFSLCSAFIFPLLDSAFISSFLLFVFCHSVSLFLPSLLCRSFFLSLHPFMPQHALKLTFTIKEPGPNTENMSF